MTTLPWTFAFLILAMACALTLETKGRPLWLRLATNSFRTALGFALVAAAVAYTVPVR